MLSVLRSNRVLCICETFPTLVAVPRPPAAHENLRRESRLCFQRVKVLFRSQPNSPPVHPISQCPSVFLVCGRKAGRRLGWMGWPTPSSCGGRSWLQQNTSPQESNLGKNLLDSVSGLNFRVRRSMPSSRGPPLACIQDRPSASCPRTA